MDTKNLKVLITGDATSLNNTFGKVKTQAKEVNGSLGKVSKTVRGVGEESEKGSGSVAKFTKAFVFGNIIFSLAADAAVKLKEGVSDIVDQANVAAKTQAQLNAVIKSTGGVAGVTAKSANELAESIRNTTTVDDDAALSAENMLLTFRDIGKKTFPTATKAVIDMATAMNGGATPNAEKLRDTAIQVGKALQDPIKGVTTLRRVGVQLSDAQQKQVKHFVDINEKAKAQKVILDELSKEFGGSAAKTAETFSGKLQQLKNKLDDVGKGIVLNIERRLNNALPAFEKLAAQTIKLGRAVQNNLDPSFKALWHTFQDKLLPDLQVLWKKVLVPLIAVIGVTLVVAVRTFVDTLNDLLNFLADNKKAVLIVASAITVFLLPALVKAGIAAVNTGRESVIASLQSSTAWIRSAVATSAAFYKQMAKVVAQFVVTAAKAVAQAAVTSAQWVASAVVSAAAWLVQLPRILAQMSVVAVKSVIYAADTSLAWVINAARVSFVWVTQELPKLAVGFVTTAAKATVQAALTSAVWIANAVKTSTAWVITELPKIMLSFVATSASASINAVTTSAAWILSASKTAIAWVVLTLPKIIATFVAMSVSATINAGIASGAWIKSAATTSKTFGALRALIATPMLMPAIVIAAALVSLDKVFRAVQTVIGAVRQMNSTNKAIAANNDSMQAAEQSIINNAKSGKITHKKAAYLLSHLDQRASGGPVNAGQTYLVGEKGPELFTAGQTGQIVNANKTSQMLGNGGSPSSISLNVNVGMYAGMPVEKRQIALELYKELVRAARSQGVSLPMIGAVPVQ